MNNEQSLLQAENKINQIFHATVIAIHDDESISVSCEGDKPEELLCDILQTSEGTRLRLAPGDNVLVLLSEDDEKRGVVLGRIGPSRTPDIESDEKQNTPDEIVIEAKNNLTFKCGDGSITLRKDGKILIKGKDLVSRAKRMNRIKGGSVAIN